MRTERIIAILLLMCCVMFVASGGYASILTTKHNLSAGGLGDVRAVNENRVCVFCHTPHHATSVVPLWSRTLSSGVYNLYGSATLVAKPGQPTGASRLCLSCHDGTIAIGLLGGQGEMIDMEGGLTTLPVGLSNLKTDLSDDHPISFVYDTNLSVQRGDLVDPAVLPGEIKLEDGFWLQCTSCHNPHKDPNGMFLVLNDQFSALCLTCHDKSGWQTSTHATDSQLAEPGCRNCHQSHGAPGSEYLLKGAVEEGTCIGQCHTVSGMGADIQTPSAEFYRHPVDATVGVHEVGENPLSAEKHVECTDCHAPHQVNGQTSTAPDVSGRLAGVSGVTKDGVAVGVASYEYEICFKCHSDNDFVNETSAFREISTTNERFRFDPENPSYHPVVALGKNSNVPSLRPEYTAYTESSRIYCSDCHGSSESVKAGGAGADGPHGSIYPHVLIDRYEQDTYPLTYSLSNYALCFRCHDPDALFDPNVTTFSDGVGSSHRTHVIGHDVPCSVCHDPHGVPAIIGATPNGNAHLINFDTRFVAAGGIYDAADLSCTVSCHGGNGGYKHYRP